MWGTVLVFALLAATDPIRIGIAVLLISRPRPLLNLFAFWLGGMVTGVSAAIGVLLVLRHVAPLIADGVTAATASPAAHQIQLGVGVLALVVAVVIGAGARFGQQVHAPLPLVDGSLYAPPTNAWARMSARVSAELAGGSLKVAFLAGLGSATPPVECLIVLAAIMASGAAIGAQLAAAMLFTVLAFAIVEIPLVSFLIAPTATCVVMLRVHQWAQQRRRCILALLIGISGVFLLVSAGV